MNYACLCMYALLTHIEDYSKESVIKECTQSKLEQLVCNNHRQNNYLKGLKSLKHLETEETLIKDFDLYSLIIKKSSI